MKLTALFRYFGLVLGLLAIGTRSQATIFTVTSTGTPSYTVTVDIEPVSLAITNPNCPYGYNYDVNYKYRITYSGTIPQGVTDMYNFQAAFTCGSDFLGYFNLPKSTTSSTGTGLTGSSKYTGNSPDCGSATLSSRGCLSGNTTLIVSGYNIQQQTITRPTSASPLPVNLLRFDAHKSFDGVFLEWTTAQAAPGDVYVLERSANAFDWTAIQQVKSDGSTRYQYTDQQPEEGTSYYRLRNTDAKGAVTYSAIMGVKVTRSQVADARIVPNPVQNETFRISGLQNPADWSVTVVNTLSQVVAAPSTATAELAVPGLPAGIYFVRLTNQKTQDVQVLKFTKN
jgi:hypothetical protein